MSGGTILENAPKLMFGRFHVLEELGAGLQGSVVRAFDTFTRAEVALKILHRQQGVDSLVRFKSEFRALAGLIHPNLVRLGELFERDQLWAFSMELVRGGDLLSWVREGCATFSEPRLRAGFAQTASALATLHRACLVHRDIKPENVRVTPDGRVVVVDLGLVVDSGPSARTASRDLVGTIGYIAPEVIHGGQATEKSDLYALGVLLYQAMTGALPYDGSLYEIAWAQRARLPLTPAERCADVPSDLDALCMALLAIDPSQRPSSGEVYGQLSRHASALSYQGSELARSEVFVGRAAELLTLEQAFHRRTPGLRSVVVRGESGIGKSALLAAFVRQVRRNAPECVVLSGRCHAREHVSYNAFDDVFDALARLLVRLSDVERRKALPANAGLLPRLSPHFAQVPGIAVDPHDETLFEAERAHLFAAFIDMLTKLSEFVSLVITMDDLHWADSDSLQLFRSMLERQQELSLCVVAASRCLAREGDAPASAQALLEDTRLASITLQPLDPATSEQLVSSLLEAEASPAIVTRLTEDAAGSPMFLVELALALSSQRAAASLDLALRSRIAALPEHARAVVQTLAVAAAPLSMGVLLATLGLKIEDLYGTLTLLQRERLVRDAASGDLMIYHDRVTQALLTQLQTDELERTHRALASVFELKVFLNPLRAAQHWISAGDQARAAPRMEEAAVRAYERAVFEQAAELYRRRLALDGVATSEEVRRALRVKLAAALAAAGHYSESAHLLLGALAGASSELRRELSVRAAQQLLQAGEIEQGMEAASLALREVELPWRQNAASAFLHLALERFQIRASQLTSLPVRDADAAQVERQLNTIVQLAHPLAWSDISRSMELSARGLLLALRQRRPDYLPMLLAAEAVQATMRKPDSDRGAALLREATSLLRPEADTRERAYCTWALGSTTLLKTKYRESVPILREAERLYRVACPDEAWMRANARGMLLNALLGVGDHAEFVTHAEAWTREAQSKGDLYARAYYSVGGQAALRYLMADDVQAALAEIDLVMRPWQATWGLHKLLRVKCVHDVMSYAGGDRAHTFWLRGARVPPLAPAFFTEGFAWRRADAALRAGLEQGNPTLVRDAARMLKPLARAATPYVRVFSGLTAMQIAIVQQRRSEGRLIAAAIEPDLRAQDDFRTSTYATLLHALDAPQAARPALWESLESWFAERGWKNPRRALSWILPISSLDESPTGRIAFSSR